MAGSTDVKKRNEKLRFPDLKYMFIRGLIKREKYQRTQHFLKSAAECTSKAIVSLDLCSMPIKSIKQALQLQGIGDEIGKTLKRILEQDNHCKGAHVNRFASSASALLVSLLCLKEELFKNDDEETYIPEDLLRQRATNNCEERFLDSFNPGFCQAWWRLNVLVRRGLVKQRSVKKCSVYELLPTGEIMALRLRERYFDKGETTPCATAETVTPDALYTNDDKTDGLVLLVDVRERGGDAVGLGQLTRLLENAGIKYRTKHLQCGDYQWIWRTHQREITLPVLIERKRADDIAESLKDGRFWNQINRMKAWQEQFLPLGVSGSLHYVFEGEPERYVVQCADGCQGVGRCGNPSLAEVQTAMKDLESHPLLTVHKTEAIMDTVNLLAILTADLGHRIFNREFDALKTTIELTTRLAASTEQKTLVTKTMNENPRNVGHLDNNPDLPSLDNADRTRGSNNNNNNNNDHKRKKTSKEFNLGMRKQGCTSFAMELADASAEGNKFEIPLSSGDDSQTGSVSSTNKRTESTVTNIQWEPENILPGSSSLGGGIKLKLKLKPSESFVETITSVSPTPKCSPGRVYLMKNRRKRKSSTETKSSSDAMSISSQEDMEVNDILMLPTTSSDKVTACLAVEMQDSIAHDSGVHPRTTSTSCSYRASADLTDLIENKSQDAPPHNAGRYSFLQSLGEDASEGENSSRYSDVPYKLAQQPATWDSESAKLGPKIDLSSEEMKRKIAMVSSIIPCLSKRTISAALVRCDYDVEECVNVLLQEDTVEVIDLT